jgi:predicted HNH restriction endonuclease
LAKRLEYTPNSKIKAALRRLWLQSRERSRTLQRDNYTCQVCGCKQSRAKGKEFSVEVHHRYGVVNWDEIYKVIRLHLLCRPDALVTLCKRCHKDIDKKEG